MTQEYKVWLKETVEVGVQLSQDRDPLIYIKGCKGKCIKFTFEKYKSLSCKCLFMRFIL